MNYYIRYLLPLIFLFFAIVALGQKNKIVQGYYITPNNDTIQCVFKSRNWKKQPLTFNVLANNNNLVLNPANVTEANIVSLEMKYVVRKITPANYNDNLLFVEDGAIPVMDSMRPAFLKCLHTGNINLYLFIDKLKRSHFFVEDKDNFLEIYFHNHKETLYVNNSRRINIDSTLQNLNPGVVGVSASSNNKQYEFVLKILMTPCRSLFSIIENIGLNEEQLLQLLTLYDKCMAIKKEEEK